MLHTPEEDATRAFGLFRALLLEPGESMAPAVRSFLAAGPDHDAVTDVPLYPAELADLAAAYVKCRQLTPDIAGRGAEQPRDGSTRRTLTDRDRAPHPAHQHAQSNSRTPQPFCPVPLAAHGHNSPLSTPDTKYFGQQSVTTPHVNARQPVTEAT